jgi:hypothetical protein
MSMHFSVHMRARTESWIYALASLVWMGVLAYLSSQPGTKVHVEPPLDKVIHLCAFGILGFLVACAAGPRLRWHAAWIATLVAALYGLGDEVHQSLTPGRSASAWDWTFDVAGGASGGAAWLVAWSQGLRRGRGSAERPGN